MNNTLSIKKNGKEINFEGKEISSDAGLLLYQELSAQLGLKKLIEENIKIHDGKNHRKHVPVDNIMQQIYSFIAGYEDNNDAKCIRKDKLFQHILEKDVLASQSTLCRFENSYTKENEEELINLNIALIKKAHKISKPVDMILDLDSTDALAYGKQEGANYNGYYKHDVFHPLFCFDGKTNDLIKGKLREGEVYTSNGVVDFIEPVLSNFSSIKLYSRGDSGFAIPELYELFENDTYSVTYFIKLKSNSVLHEIAERYAEEIELTLDFGEKNYFSFYYQASSWSKERRVLCQAKKYFGDMFLTYSFVVTNDLGCSPEWGFNFYNNRANVENNIKEGKLDLNWGRLSLHSMISNACRLQIFILSYNLNNILRRLVLPKSFSKMKLKTLRANLIKVGCKIVKHAKTLIFKLSSSFRFKEEYIASFEKISMLKT